MYQSEQHIEICKRISEKLSEISEFKKTDLIKENVLGSLNFKNESELFNEILDLFLKVEGVDFYKIPYVYCNNFISQLDSATDYFKSIRDFNINQQNPANSKESLIRNLKNNFDSYYQHTIPILSFIDLQKNDYQEKKKEIINAVQDIVKQKDSTKKEIEHYLSEIQEIVENTKKASLNVSIANFSSIFLTESNNHKDEAKFWLKSAIQVLSFIIVIGIASLIYIVYDKNLDNTKALQIGISKAILLTGLFYLLNICNKNYKSHKHNEITNKHRYNALNTFETFVKSSNDELTKNAVLLEATRTIFSSPQTGYISNESEPDVSTKVIEIFKDSVLGNIGTQYNFRTFALWQQ